MRPAAWLTYGLVVAQLGPPRRSLARDPVVVDLLVRFLADFACQDFTARDASLCSIKLKPFFQLLSTGQLSPAPRRSNLMDGHIFLGIF